MYIPLKKETVLTPEEIEKEFFINLRFDSHKFVEINDGIATCDYCGLTVNGNAGIILGNIKLCHRNPHLFDEKFFPTIEKILQTDQF
jgi:hypothetical protein